MIKQIVRSLPYILIAVTLIIFPNNSAFAKKKKKKSSGVVVTESDYFSTQVTYKLGKKTKKQMIQCLGKTPGVVKNSKFKSYNALLKKSKGNKLSKYAALAKAGKKGCVQPDFLDLDEYKGPFGQQEARILFNRFAFGAAQEQINLAVAEGLSKTVDRLTTYIAEPELDAIEKDLQCDGRLPNDPENDTCDPTDPNDLSTEGVRYGLYYKMQKSINPFFEKLFFFAHDERLSTSSSSLNSCERHALIKYVDAVKYFARSGDYKQYMKDMNNSHLMHLRWLNGAENLGSSPNENYAREFWELGTVGPTDLNGSTVYSNLDIAYSALAFSGHLIQGKNINGKWYCYSAYSSDLHAPGNKIIFNGTPYQAVVDDMDDVLEATLNHPRLAEHLAEDLWKEFVNPYAKSAAIKKLATEIRNAGYNILPAIKKLMKSKSIFAQESQETLIKHPVDLLFGFLRSTKLPLDLYYIDHELKAMGQRPLRPDTVFGWDDKALAGEAYVLEWRNVILMLMKQSDETLAEDGYDLHAQFLSGQPSVEQTVDRVANILGVELNQTQKSSLIQYLNYNLEPCSWHKSQCNAGQSYLGQGQYFLDKDLFDSDIASDNWWKVRGLVTIIGMLPQYRMK